MKKIKILYVITSLGLGGAEKLLLSYLKNLDQNKYSLNVCSLREKPDELLKDISNFASVTNLKINNRFNPNVILKLKKLIREIKPDVIHTHLFQARIYTTLAQLFHRDAILIAHKHNSVNFKKHNIFILLEMFSIHLNKKVIAISESVKQSLVKYELIPAKKIYVLPNSIDYHNFNKNVRIKNYSKENHIIIGTVCRLEKQKGIKYLLLAMKTILAKFPNARLEIVGDGSLLEELQNQCIDLGISNSVFFFGKFTDVIPFYKRMDIFVLPSIYEGFGIVILEAMAIGVPVVATNVDGIREVVVDGESGILIPPKNPESIADAISYIIEHPQVTDSFIKEGIKRASLFDIEQHIMKLDNLYTTLLRTESYQ